jgi:S-adenosylmethionine:tRNA ribosyltransferase-isomerase
MVASCAMKVADFHYELPSELIAQYPPEHRSDSRLLRLASDGQISDRNIADILDDLNPDDLLVLNNTKVIPARLFGSKSTGGRVEVLLERVTGNNEFIAQIRSSRSPKVGQQLHITGDDSVVLTVIGRQATFFVLSANQDGSLFEWLHRVGHIPLPPYIDRADNALDEDRYQTVFAEHEGAVAAPTAGLHYDEDLLARIRDKGVRIETVTLHVGAGTYQPVRVDTIDQHQMHSEYIEVSEQVCEAVMTTKASGNKVIAVGTTVVRSLETAARAAGAQLIAPYAGDTDIFIYPGFNFKVVDMLQTNFHLPESTLLMLVSAFAGYEHIMSAYKHAIAHKYRFFSYGDAMLLEREQT